MYITYLLVDCLSCSTQGRNAVNLVYASDETWSGPDDYLWDADDELVFMARHLGGKHSGGGEASLPFEVQFVSGNVILFTRDGHGFALTHGENHFKEGGGQKMFWSFFRFCKVLVNFFAIFKIVSPHFEICMGYIHQRKPFKIYMMVGQLKFTLGVPCAHLCA